MILLEPLPPANRFGSHRPHNHSLDSAPEAPAQGPKLEVHGLGSHLPSARRSYPCRSPCSPHSTLTRPMVGRLPCQDHAPYHLLHPNQTPILLLSTVVDSRACTARTQRSPYLPPHEKESVLARPGPCGSQHVFQGYPICQKSPLVAESGQRRLAICLGC